jgi:hypothetical protein
MRSFGLAITVMVAALSLAACPEVKQGDSGTGGAGGATLLYAESPCGVCVAEVCAGQIDLCAAEPECAAALECLRACPLAPSGDADPACEASCPLPSSETAANALTTLTTCRVNGVGATCEACGHPPTGHPLLNQMCEPPTAIDACDRCEEEFCCETRCDAACEDYASCMQGCGNDPSCQDGCAASHPEGVAELGRWLGCQVPLCGDVCMSLIPGPCLGCGVENCPNQFADCFANADCFLRFFCGTRCDTTDCYLDCDAQYPEASALFGALLLCIGNECSGGSCSGGL